MMIAAWRNWRTSRSRQRPTNSRPRKRRISVDRHLSCPGDSRIRVSSPWLLASRWIAARTGSNARGSATTSRAALPHPERRVFTQTSEPPAASIICSKRFMLARRSNAPGLLEANWLQEVHRNKLPRVRKSRYEWTERERVSVARLMGSADDEKEGQTPRFLGSGQLRRG